MKFLKEILSNPTAWNQYLSQIFSFFDDLVTFKLCFQSSNAVWELCQLEKFLASWNLDQDFKHSKKECVTQL